MNLEEIAMKIICDSGECKSLSFEAIEEAKKGNVDIAKEKLKQAKEKLLKAHEYQTNLIVEEARGNKVEVSLLMVHSQDHLMSSSLAMELVERIIELY